MPWNHPYNTSSSLFLFSVFLFTDKTVSLKKAKWKSSSITTSWLPWWLSIKESACSAGDVGDLSLIPGSGRSPGEGNGNPLQYFCLGNPVDRGAWQATNLGVTESDPTERLNNKVARLLNFQFSPWSVSCFMSVCVYTAFIYVENLPK